LAGEQVLAVAACPISLNGRADWPVLVGTKIFDGGAVSGLAERAGGTVAISDGRRLLASAPGGTGDEQPALKQAMDVAPPGLVTVGNDTVAVLPLPGGLRVLVGITAPASAAPGLPLPWPALVILLIGLTLAIALFVVLSRQAPVEPVATLAPAADDDAVAMIGRYTIVERIGQGGMADIYAAVAVGDGNLRRPVVI